MIINRIDMLVFWKVCAHLGRQGGYAVGAIQIDT
jgi:hypothetical protein